MLIKKNLFTPDKLDYARGKRPDVECILCAVLKNNKKVDRLLVHSGKLMHITLNLYPYNPGHLMIFPVRHLTDTRELTETEWLELFKLKKMSMDVLDSVYNPKGYNLGFNVGVCAGASISHIHFHIVPRYNNEIGFIETITDGRLIVESPSVSRKKIISKFKKLN